jgi:hypothetical protein
MKKIIIALAATTILGVAAPASAQSLGANLDVRINQLQADLQAGVRSGAITRNEAMPLRQQLRQLRDLERHYAQGGFSRGERNELHSRIVSLRQSIAMAARTGDGRYGDGRYDRDDRDGRYGRDCPPGLEKRNNGCLPPGQVGRDDRDGRWSDGDRWNSRERMDRNRDGYDDRDLNRDGRIDDREWRIAQERFEDDRRYDRDGDRYEDRDDRYEDRYEDREQRRGGLGGIVDGLLGRDTLRVGQRVSANARLGPVPYEYRSRFRDGGGVYYRSDGRSIFEIDARTDVVLRIYGMSR